MTAQPCKSELLPHYENSSAVADLAHAIRERKARTIRNAVWALTGIDTQ